MFAQLLVAAAVCVTGAAAAEWKISEGMTPVTVLVGLHATKSSEIYCAISDNSLGPGLLHSEDSGATDEYIGPAGGLMNMDVAFTEGGLDGAMVGMGGVFVTHDSRSYTRLDDITGISQNVAAFGSQLIGATGQFFSKAAKQNANGLALSSDAGSSWQLFDIGLNSSDYIARYAAFPSEQTWFVSSGIWPMDSDTAESQRQLRKIALQGDASSLPAHATHWLTAGVGRTLKKSFTAAAVSDDIVFAGDSHKFLRTATGTATGSSTGGYVGGISKTTDGGSSWTKVLDLEGLAYFNEVHCADEMNCIAAAENDERGFGYLTSDGGSSWRQVLATDTAVSLAGAVMLSASEAWLTGGAMVQGKGLTGFYYHTVDGGASWELSQLPQGYSMDVSFNDGVGYSVALNQAYSTVAVYN